MRLKGGLGNQLFQFAATYSMALARGETQIYVDTTGISDTSLHETETPRKFELDFVPPAILRIDPLHDNFGKSGYFSGIKQPFLEVRDFVPSLVRSAKIFPGPVLLTGYFQHEAFFRGAVNSVREAIRYRENKGHEELSAFRTQQARISSLAIHVRRTDYLSKPGSIHGFVGLDYYQKALSLVRADRDYDEIFVYSDDPEWVAEQQVFKGFTHAEPAYVERPIELLWHMSAASDFIIANSSFSWWAAWLGESPAKRVIAPRPWFTRAVPYWKNPALKEWALVNRE